MFLFLRQVNVTVTQWSLTLRDLMYSSPPDSSVHGILQARQLKGPKGALQTSDISS